MKGITYPLVVLITVFCTSALHTTTALSINGQDVVDVMLQLAKITDAKPPAVTRVLFTPKDIEARNFIKKMMTDVGLAVREDPMGNCFGRWEGSDSSSRGYEDVVMTGSHTDAIPNAGLYDGVLGVVGALAAVSSLKASGFTPRRSIEVVHFTSEEPTRFGLGCIGSRGMSGYLSPKELDKYVDANGTSFLEASNAAGYDGKSHYDILERTRLRKDIFSKAGVHSFVELHIEQGPILEKEGFNIGVVSAIAAPASFRVTYRGDGGHAGAQLMPWRNDASLAAAELALLVEMAAKSTEEMDTVGTVGSWSIAPNTVNSVPNFARLEVDIRDIEKDRRDAVLNLVLKGVKDIAQRRKVKYEIEMINQDLPTACHYDVMAAIEGSARDLGLSSKYMVSRAYHDALFMAQIAPASMIFIPCKNGWSHRPDEFASVDDITRGVAVLGLTLARLSEGAVPAQEAAAATQETEAPSRESEASVPEGHGEL